MYVSLMDKKTSYNSASNPFKKERGLACPGGVSFRQTLHDEPEVLDRNCRVLK
jgi:hypothetical protein